MTESASAASDQKFEVRAYEAALAYLTDELEAFRQRGGGGKKVPDLPSAELIEGYCTLPSQRTELAGASGLFNQLLCSLINRNRVTNAIKWERLNVVANELLHDSDPCYTLDNYGEDPKAHVLLNAMRGRFSALDVGDPLYVDESKFEPGNKVWHGFAKGVISGAKFLVRTDEGGGFAAFAAESVANADPKARAALPQRIADEVYGLGFALACDFLKESGYDYPKPDVHIKEFFRACGLAEDDDHAAYEAVFSMAASVRKTAYHVDKLFWLIGSGDFYMHGFKIRPSIKERFIEKLQEMSVERQA